MKKPDRRLLSHCKPALALILGCAGFLSHAAAQDFATKQFPVRTPDSSLHNPGDAGMKEHTHLRILVVNNHAASPAASSTANTPATIRSAYNLPTTGGSNAIAIVDAYDYATALNDFNTFSSLYALPQETSTSPTASNAVLQVVYATGTKPTSTGSLAASWNLEEALDIEWAHAMAPNAKIYLVEAASSSTSDLMTAVRAASRIVGVKEVSMSWGSSEYRGETSSDSYYNTSGIVYVASGGDSSEVEYPSVSPYVVAAGGTTLNRSSNGTLTSETDWSDTGCGPSVVEPRPTFQNVVASIVGAKRGTTDISFDANPNTGVSVYDSTPYEGESGWYIVGGTSVSSPCLAGVINLAATSKNNFASNSTAELTLIYSSLGNASDFRDITSGTRDGRYKAAVGWDYITGVGSPQGLGGE